MKDPRLKDLGRWYSGGTPPRGEAELWAGDLPWVSGKDFDDGALRAPSEFVTEQAASEHSRIVGPGAILVLVRGMALVHGLPLAITSSCVCFNQDVRALVPHANVDPKFAFYALTGARNRLNAHIDKAAHGTTRVGASVYSERLSVPELADQRRIVAFLDQECRRIMAIISLRRRAIALLDEEERSTIDDLLGVSREAAPGQRAWLDDRPAHWRAVPLGYLAKVQTGVTLGKDYANAELFVRPYLRVANVKADGIDLTDVKKIEVPMEAIVGTELRAGDVLLTEGGDADKLGRGSVWDGSIEGCLHQNHVFAVRPLASLDPYFLALVSRSSHGRAHFTSTANQTTNLASTNLQKVSQFVVPLPPLAEQRAIVREFGERQRALRQLREAFEQQMSALRGYREALIRDAVTGALKPREAVAKDPALDAAIEEIEALDAPSEELMGAPS